MTAEKITLVVDTKQRRPACVLLQAGFGCSGYREVMHRFDSKTWLTFPTPDMRRVSGTIEEWQSLADEINPRH